MDTKSGTNVSAVTPGCESSSSRYRTRAWRVRTKERVAGEWSPSDSSTVSKNATNWRECTGLILSARSDDHKPGLAVGIRDTGGDGVPAEKGHPDCLALEVGTGHAEDPSPVDSPGGLFLHARFDLLRHRTDGRCPLIFDPLPEPLTLADTESTVSHPSSPGFTFSGQLSDTNSSRG